MQGTNREKLVPFCKSKLIPTILNDMVNDVYVHAPNKSSGHRVQDMMISYNYIGILPANLLYNVINKKAA